MSISELIKRLNKEAVHFTASIWLAFLQSLEIWRMFNFLFHSVSVSKQSLCSTHINIFLPFPSLTPPPPLISSPLQTAASLSYWSFWSLCSTSSTQRHLQAPTPDWKPPFPKYFVSSNQCPFKPHSRKQSVLDKLKVPSCEVFKIDLKSKNTLVIESRQQLSDWM